MPVKLTVTKHTHENKEVCANDEKYKWHQKCKSINKVVISKFWIVSNAVSCDCFVIERRCSKILQEQYSVVKEKVHEGFKSVNCLLT